MAGERFAQLVEIMKTLRGPEGCPWDREQDLRSLQPMLIEEVYEVVEAVDNQNFPGLAEELGDLLLHIVFHAELGRELDQFDIDDVVNAICEKLVRRHPHVFGEHRAEHPSDALETWEAMKKREKERSGAADTSVLDGIPPRLPALHEAHKISERVARQGFDWKRVDDVLEKLAEETQELREASGIEDPAVRADEIEGEIGDMLFVLVNVARHLGVDSESALKRSNRKFRQRFRHIEQALRRRGRPLLDASAEELEALWGEAKAREDDLNDA